MIIRQGTLKDTSDVTDLLLEFHNESLAEYNLEFEIDKAIQAWEKCWENSLVIEIDTKVIGVIAGVIVRHELHSKQTFQEMVWFVTKNHRRFGIRLLKAMEDRCREKGISSMVMGHLSNCKREKIERLYSRIGYKAFEVQYIKAL